MRVVYDYQIFGAQEFGGVSRYFCALASHLARLDAVTAKIVAPLHINRHLRQAREGVAVGRYLPRLPRTGRLIGALNARLFPLAAAGVHPDVVHETYFAPRQTYPGKALRVLTVYDMIHERYVANFSPTDRTAAFKRRAVERADIVVCISENTRRDLLELLQMSPERTVVTHLGYDALNPGETRANDLTEGAPYLLYVGARYKYKNFLGLARAYAGSPRLRTSFRIVCFGGGSLTRAEQSELHALGLTNEQVVQVGGDDDMLGRLYAGAYAFVYPSKYEGFGIPPLEAMSLGCPVICSNTSSIPEVAGDAAEYFDPDDLHSIATAIERAVYSDARRNELIALGRARCRIFSWERCARETRAAYERALA